MGKHTTNEKALGLQSEGSENHTTNEFDFTANNPAQYEFNLEFNAEKKIKQASKYSRKSTAIEAQYERVDWGFDYVGKLISTIDFRRMGVIHPSGRIKEMNEKLGYHIAKVELRTVIDEQGYSHPRIAFYELLGRPNKAGAA